MVKKLPCLKPNASLVYGTMDKPAHSVRLRENNSTIFDQRDSVSRSNVSAVSAKRRLAPCP